MAAAGKLFYQASGSDPLAMYGDLVGLSHGLFMGLLYYTAIAANDDLPIVDKRVVDLLHKSQAF